jgi:hypothetical protein
MSKVSKQMSKDQTLDDGLLDSALDDLSDLPEFKPFPAGAYRVAFEFTEKKVNDKPSVELKMKCLEVLELAEEQEEKDVPVAGKSESSVLMILKNNDGSRNEIAEGQLKNILKSIQPVVGGANIREVMANAKGAEFNVVLKTKLDKKNDVLRQQIHEIITG